MSHNITVRITLPGAEEQTFQECYETLHPSDASTKGLSAMLTKLHELQDKTQKFLTEKINDDSNPSTAHAEDGYEEEGVDDELPSPSSGPPKKRNKKGK
ncbi:hypothetical protein GUITHDRAFT_111005 [Guillardia theta CCMP2712]|uniref:Uncharacterized protein n=1 Tax=Guillardia theta (strain CCMP2712) TaxID=905079 RepID=L1J3R5_GUITC|nr:hypothetical protein GUITHDRAFT_111005 [Guillardia theta CCMP2712]EKX42957.1 hypothetical protein GUITHDRAFT_111005 [Guillardia theta CCMP2712]|mmetsp:Transcript_8423/g.28270  ORF Transcript_8423/g.28270 Transcript_8423/m.28270 type:complete len:99 (-) Transcript_8423:56-352(-)|eukprot:XP_005829937.1 hypothetical protein GUITHDRAFT_111005 [Guillardia theta CCMP2712]